MRGVSRRVSEMFEEARAADLARPDAPPPEPVGKWLFVVNATDSQAEAIRLYLRRLGLTGARPRRVAGYGNGEGEGEGGDGNGEVVDEARR